MSEENKNLVEDSQNTNELPKNVPPQMLIQEDDNSDLNALISQAKNSINGNQANENK